MRQGVARGISFIQAAKRPHIIGFDLEIDHREPLSPKPSRVNLRQGTDAVPDIPPQEDYGGIDPCVGGCRMDQRCRPFDRDDDRPLNASGAEARTSRACKNNSATSGLFSAMACFRAARATVSSFRFLMVMATSFAEDPEPCALPRRQGQDPPRYRGSGAFPIRLPSSWPPAIALLDPRPRASQARRSSAISP